MSVASNWGVLGVDGVTIAGLAEGGVETVRAILDDPTRVPIPKPGTRRARCAHSTVGFNVDA